MLDVYPAREEPVGPLAGVSGLDVARAAADHAAGRPVWWLVDVERAERALAPRLRRGRPAGDDRRRRRPPARPKRWSRAGLRADDAPASGRADEMSPPDGRRARLSAGAADDRAHGRPGRPVRPPRRRGRSWCGCSRWAAAEGVAVGVVGSGSNLLVSDQGFRGLVLKLDGELSAIERAESRVVCGGGARLPSAAAQAARWGLSGLEFGINIPGTVGGAVRMNANAYGGELGRVLEWVTVCTAEGVERREPSELGFAYRRSNLRAGRGRLPRLLPARRGRPSEIKGTLAEMRGKRREAQPSGIKTFGSTFKNPADDARAEGRTAGQLLEAAGMPRASRSAAPGSPRCTRTSSRTPATRPPPTSSP